MAWTPPESYTLDQVVGVTEMHKIRDNMRELWHEVAYVEFTGVVTSNTSTDVLVVSSGSVTFAGFPVFVQFSAPAVQTGSAGGNVWLWYDGAHVGSLVPPGVTTNGGFRRLTPAAGSRTFQIYMYGTAGTPSVATAGAGTSSTIAPGFIRILEKGGA